MNNLSIKNSKIWWFPTKWLQKGAILRFFGMIRMLINTFTEIFKSFTVIFLITFLTVNHVYWRVFTNLSTQSFSQENKHIEKIKRARTIFKEFRIIAIRCSKNSIGQFISVPNCNLVTEILWYFRQCQNVCLCWCSAYLQLCVLAVLLFLWHFVC